MDKKPFPRQEEKDRAGGQHGTQPSDDPQLKRVHENAESEELPHRNDTSVEDGSSRHRTQ